MTPAERAAYIRGLRDAARIANRFLARERKWEVTEPEFYGPRIGAVESVAERINDAAEHAETEGEAMRKRQNENTG